MFGVRAKSATMAAESESAGRIGRWRGRGRGQRATASSSNSTTSMQTATEVLPRGGMYLLEKDTEIDFTLPSSGHRPAATVPQGISARGERWSISPTHEQSHFTAASRRAKSCAGWPEEPWNIEHGKGAHAGKPPRGAGILAMMVDGRECIDGDTMLCVVEKKGRRFGFPKGGRHRGGETVLEGAKREWKEETGIPLRRVQLLEGAYVDDDYIGCRYLVAWCFPPAAGSSDPDAQGAPCSWAPPCEDEADDDPIVRAHWKSLRDAKACLRKDLHLHVVGAAEQLAAAGCPSNQAAPVPEAEPATVCAVPASTRGQHERNVLNAAKKLREILKLEKKRDAGETLEKTQLSKLEKLDEQQLEFDEFVRMLAADSVVWAKIQDLLPDTNGQ